MRFKPIKMKKRGPAERLGVFVEVLQNGSTLASAVAPMRRSGFLELTAAGNGPFVLPYYPLPDGRLEFLQFGDGGAHLVIDHKREGFLTSKGELIHIARGSKEHRRAAMYKGDYASLTYDDLRLMIKIGPFPKKGPRAIVHTNPSTRRPFTAHFFPSIYERRSLAAATAATALLLGSVIIGLLSRGNTRPREIAEIPEQYLLSFLAPDHIKHAPEALQGNYDRKHPAHSAHEFYRSVAGIFMGWEDYNPKLLFKTTIDLYKRLHSEQRQDLRTKIARQEEVDRLQLRKSGVGILTVPSVMGESMSSSMLRLIDKIDVMQQGFGANLEAKRQIVRDFPNDPNYVWTEYHNIPKPTNATNEATSKIKVFDQLTPEAQMYDQVEKLANSAARRQNRIFRQRGDDSFITGDTYSPIFIQEGAKFSSFLASEQFQRGDDKLYSLRASDFEADRKSEPQVKEPLTGDIEPALVERFIQANRFQLQICYELALRRDESTAGTMEWRWRIDSLGTIADVNLKSSTIHDQRMAECIRQKIAAWRFPRPRRGSVEVHYPFEFTPAKG